MADRYINVDQDTTTQLFNEKFFAQKVFLKRKTFGLLTTNKPNTNRAAILKLSNMVILVVLDLVMLVEEEKNIFERNPRKVQKMSQEVKC